MAAVYLLPLLFSLALKQDFTLRTGCAEDDDVVARVPAGSALQIRFGRADSGGICYKVSLQKDGRAIEGYVPASAIAGLEEYERQRQSAGWVRA